MPRHEDAGGNLAPKPRVVRWPEPCLAEAEGCGQAWAGPTICSGPPTLVGAVLLFGPLTDKETEAQEICQRSSCDSARVCFLQNPEKSASV